MDYYFRSLSKDLKLAKILAYKINIIFDELLTMIKLGLEPTTKKLGISKHTEKSPYKTFIELDRSEDANKTIFMYMKVLSVLLPKDISTLTYSSIDTIMGTIKNLPRRSMKNYKKLPIQKLIQMDIPESDRLSERGINGYLKTLKSYLNFCYKRNYIDKQFDINLVKKSNGARDERKALDINAIQKLVEGSSTAKLQSAYTLLYLTGLRVSEAYKCNVTTVNGVRCFDLTDRTIQLKTNSSHRLIPVHKSIKNPEKLLEDVRSMTSDYIARHCKKNLQEGTLYSLRHSFATHLASSSVEPHIISELMGHTHKTMTLSRYVKGFPIQTLKDAIDTLPTLLSRDYLKSYKAFT